MKWFGRKRGPEFVCGVCGKAHSGLLADYGYSLPDAAWAESAEDRQAMLDWSTDVCYHRGNWFLRGVLEVPLDCEPGRFRWGIWAEVSEEMMGRYQAVFDQDGSDQPREPGRIANQIATYPETLGLEIEVQFGPPDMRPTFHGAGPEAIFQEQRNGIDCPRYQQILRQISPSPQPEVKG